MAPSRLATAAGSHAGSDLECAHADSHGSASAGHAPSNEALHQNVTATTAMAATPTTPTPATIATIATTATTAMTSTIADTPHRRDGRVLPLLAVTTPTAVADDTQPISLASATASPQSPTPQPTSSGLSSSPSSLLSSSTPHGQQHQQQLVCQHQALAQDNTLVLTRQPSFRAWSRTSSREDSSYPSTNKCCASSIAGMCHHSLGTSNMSLCDLPNELLLHIVGFLDVNDLLAMSRTSHHLRCLCRSPIVHILWRRHVRAVLPPLLASPSRPSLADLIARSIFLTKTTVVSRQLARSLVAIRLSRRLAARPPVQVLVERCVLPPECAPGIGHVAPALVARARAIEREQLKDELRRWVGAVWRREVGRRSEHIRRSDESRGIGKVWRLRKFWERVSRSGSD